MKRAKQPTIRLAFSKRVDPARIRALYRAAGWTEDIARYSPAQIRKLLKHSHLILTAKNQKHELVGFASAVSDGVLCALVQNLVVHPDYRGRGLGSRLLRELTRTLRKEGISCIYVLGTRTRKARGFFSRVGFQPLRWNVFVRLAR